MTDDLNTPESPLTPSEPTVQPVSIHDTPHQGHGAWPLIAGMLGVFLVLESIALGYGVMRVVEIKGKIDTAKDTAASRKEELAQKVEEAKDKIPPILYIKPSQPSSPYGQELHQINRLTGQDTLVMDFGASKAAQLVAVPQVGYDGRVFLHIVGEGVDNPYLHLYSLDLNDENAVPTPIELPVDEGMQSQISMSAIAVSPDQTKLAYVPFDASIEPGGESRKLLLLNLVTGEKSTLGLLNEMAGVPTIFSFAQLAENTIGGTVGPLMDWTSTTCVTAMVFESPSPVNGNNSQTFCE